MEENPIALDRSVEEEMKESYLRYSMSVIIARALPDIRDGLKPSQRRILFAMRQLGLSPTGKHRKCAKICGDTSGDYHPHGESVIYPTLARMAQEWIVRYPLVHGQGNFGSVDGDPPGAMRYTEARTTAASISLMDDLDKETVPFVPNYDETKKEPTVFPSRFPNLLANGSSGIAVGMATNIPPHNLSELADAMVYLIRNPDASLEDIMEIMPAPDFPTGGLICGLNGVREAYRSGRGKVTLRAVAAVEQKGNNERIVIDEIPYNVNKARLLEQIAELVNDKQVEGISDLRDESDKKGLSIVIDVKKNAMAEVVLNQLYKFTDLQVTYGCNMVALDGGLPRLCSLRHMMDAWVIHRIEMVVCRTRYELGRAKARAHLLEGYLKALNAIDRVVAIVRGSVDRDNARQLLIIEIDITTRQADAILDMRLYRLTGLEFGKIEKEHAELLKQIEEYEAVLASNERVREIICEELIEMKGKYGSERRSKIVPHHDDLQMEDLIPDEQVLLTLSQDDYIKRMSLTHFKEQRRGGQGVAGMDLSRENDVLKCCTIASSHDMLLFFSNFGRCYWSKAWQVPEAGRKAKGKPIVHLLEMGPGESLAALLRVSSFDQEGSILLSTRRGVVKRTQLDAFSNPRKKGVIALNIDEGDELTGAQLVHPSEQVMLFTKHGMAVRFDVEEVRPMGRSARGVRGVMLKNQDDYVVACEVVNPEMSILVVCEKGFGKRSCVEHFRQTKRGGVGVRSIVTNDRNGFVLGALAVEDKDSVVLMSQDGQTIRIPMGDVRVMGRSTQGVCLTKLSKGRHLVSMQRINAVEE